MPLTLAATVVTTLATAATLALPTTPAHARDDAPSRQVPTAGEAGTGAVGDNQDSRGTWEVAPSGPAAWTLAWQADSPLPVTSDRPVLVRTAPADGSALQSLPGLLSEDRTTVTATVHQTQAPDPDDWDARLSGRTLDAVTSTAPPAPAPSTKIPVGSRLLGSDPAAPGAARVVESDYELAPVNWPGYAKPIEMVAHVAEPERVAGAAKRPVVLFLHGRHGVCYRGKRETDTWPCTAPEREIPSHLGYRYLQQRLASQGYYTVSVRANGINAQDGGEADGGAGARAMLVSRHLQRLAQQAGPLNLDLTRVVLVGHSRGGEGVNRVALRTPLTAPYRIVGQLLLAPTNFGGQTAPYVNTVTVLPSCDGDVSDLQGQQYVDVSRDLLADDTSWKSAVLMVGGNHNFFNTEWTPRLAVAPAEDDAMGDVQGRCGAKDVNRASASQQRSATLALLTGAVRLFAGGEQRYAPLFDGSDVRAASAGTVALRSHTLGRGRTVLRPGGQFAVGSVTGTGSALRCRGVSMGEATSTRPPACGDGLSTTSPHFYDTGYLTPRPKDAVWFSWTRAGTRVALDLSAPRDFSRSSLTMRVAVDPTRVDKGVRFADLRVALTDSSGRTALVAAGDGARLWAVPGGSAGGVGVRWAQSLTVDPRSVSGQVDLRAIRSVALVAGTARGGVHVLDVELVPDSVPEVAAKRSALVSVGLVRQREGNARGQGTVRVPITVVGQLSAPARFRVEGAGARKALGGEWLTIHPGQQAVHVPVAYRRNRAWGGDRDLTVNLVPDHGAMTDVWSGGATVLEDDPRPRLSLVPVAGAVSEGGTIKVRVKLSSPLDTTTYLGVGFGKVKGHELSARDVDLTDFQYTGRGGTRLSRTRAYRGMEIRAGRRSVVVRLPVLRDRQREPWEKARLEVELPFPDGSTARKSLVVRVKPS